jgi:16S rRNA (guanine527-N7)-methyltransferase
MILGGMEGQGRENGKSTKFVGTRMVVSRQSAVGSQQSAVVSIIGNQDCEMGSQGIELIVKYLPELSPMQLKQFGQLESLYRTWNARINVISRQDIDNLYERHILHSLAIARVVRFKPGTNVLDAGTGGGFPGIPLAILFPETHFHLVDSTAKKLTVIKEIAKELEIQNITTEHIRLESHFQKYDFIVSRAVTSIDQMLDWVWKNVKTAGFNDIPNGLLYLKGMEAEMQGTIEQLSNRAINSKTYHLKDYFEEPFFESKILIHLF